MNTEELYSKAIKNWSPSSELHRGPAFRLEDIVDFINKLGNEKYNASRLEEAETIYKVAKRLHLEKRKIESKIKSIHRV